MRLDHAARQLYLCWRLVCFDAKAADGFANDKTGARRSFVTLWFSFPYAMLMGYVAERTFIGRYNVDVPYYFALRTALYALSLFAGLLAAYALCRAQKLEANFSRWVVSYNWLNVLLSPLLLPVTLCIAWGWMPAQQLITLGIITYFFTLYVSWVHSWRMLKCTIFEAAGIAIAPVIIAGVLSDLSNLRLYGVVRPFFEGPLGQ